MISQENLAKLRTCVHLIEVDSVYYLFATQANRLFRLSSSEVLTVKALLSEDVSLSVSNNQDFLEKLYHECVLETVYGSEPILNSLVLLVSEACNFACTYCYGSYGRRCGKMNTDIAIKAIDLARELGIRDVVFFGGEPLTNLAVVKEAVEYIERTWDGEYSLRMTTNGSLITEEIASYLQDHHFQVSVSMDGDKASQDLTRVYQNNESTYQDVLQGIHLLIQHKVLSLLEITYSDRHLDLCNQLRTALEIFPIVSCACVDGNPDSEMNPDIVSGEKMISYYNTLLDVDKELDGEKQLLGARELFDRICNNDPFVTPKYLCSDIGTRLIVASDGRVAPCPEMIDRKEYTICNIADINSAARFMELRSNVLSKLSSNRLNRKWFTGLCETCIQHVREEDSRFEYINANTFHSCMEVLLSRFIKEQNE